MTAGTEILNYQPNEKLGLGGNADIPAIYSDNNVINQTGRDLMLLNHENNVNLWRQKIADRDKQLELIDKGQIATGRVLDRDKPWLKGLETTADKSFEQLVKQKPGTEGYASAYRDYQKNLTNYKDAVTVAQHNQLGVDTLNVAESKEPLAFKQKRIAEFRNKELSKPAGASVGSYIPVLDYDADAINNWGEGVVSGSVTSTPTGTTEKVSVTDVAGKPSKTVTTKTNAPLSGKQPQAVGEIIYKDGLPYSRTKQFIDFDKIKYNKISQYADDAGEQHENQENHRKAYETAPDNIYEPVMNRIIQRVKDYNSDKGLQQGDAGYLDPTETAKKLGIDPMTGKRTGQRIMFSTPEFAALTALANYGGSYAPATDNLLKDEAKLLQDKSELGEKIRAAKAKEGIDWYDAKTKRINATKKDGTIIQTGIQGNALNGIPLTDATRKDGEYNLTPEAGKKYLGQIQEVMGRGTTENPGILTDEVINSNDPKNAISIKVKGGIIQSITIKNKEYSRQEIENMQKARDKEAKVSEHQQYPIEQSYISTSSDRKEPETIELKKEYTLNGKKFSIDKIKKAAKESSMTVDEYIKEYQLQ